VVFYTSGKLVIQGRDAEAVAVTLSPTQVLGGGTRFDDALSKLPSDVEVWIGSDESGKGDYFGPLVTCAVRVERSQVPLLDELGAADCKQMSDAQVLEAAPILAAAVPHAKVVISPPRYNALYRDMGENLNRLLAWSHARAIEDVETAHPGAQLLLVDQFGPSHRVLGALMERGAKIPLMQRTKAEDDPAVAVASVLARASFLHSLRRLGREIGVPLAKGAGGPVIAAGRRLIAEKGVDALGEVAKLHFKTTETLRKGK
jgi:ribonuclease HIII